MAKEQERYQQVDFIVYRHGDGGRERQPKQQQEGLEVSSALEDRLKVYITTKSVLVLLKGNSLCSVHGRHTLQHFARAGQEGRVDGCGGVCLVVYKDIL